MEDFIPEKYIEKSPSPISIEKMEKILFQMKNSICRIINNDGQKGTGFFCRIPYNDNLIPFLITNNHVLNESKISNGKRVEFTINDGKKTISFDIDDSRIKFTNKDLDVTFIEIKPNKDSIDYILDIDEEINTNLGNLYNNKSIYIMHYPKGNNVHVSYGLSNKREGNDFYHLCSTEEGSSGSPILSLDSLRVIAIHKGAPNRTSFKFNLGTFIKNAIDLFNQPINKTSNNINNFNNKNIVNNQGNIVSNNSINNINNSNNNSIYIAENFQNNISNPNSNQFNNMNYNINQMNMNMNNSNIMSNNNNGMINSNNISNNNINLYEINQSNNNYMSNSMTQMKNINAIDYNNFYGINQLNNASNQMNNFFGMNQMVNYTLIRLNMEFKLCCKDESLATIVSNFRLVDENLYKWKVEMIGPKETPYEGGIFTIQITFLKDYPKKGPEFNILNKIYHLNVDTRKESFGHISMTRLNEWRTCGMVSDMPGYNVKQALFDIFYLIGKCGDTDSPYDDKMAYQLRTNPEEFHKIAKEWTKKYASL